MKICPPNKYLDHVFSCFRAKIYKTISHREMLISFLIRIDNNSYENNIFKILIINFNSS